jgi:hypothetical protein
MSPDPINVLDPSGPQSAKQTFIKSLGELLDDKGEKNYDPRMEELLRSDRLIDPNNELLTKLENEEIYHISKIRGAQKGFLLTVRRIRKVYNLPWMLDYHTDYMDYIRALDEKNEHDKVELDSIIGDLKMTSEMISQMIKLRHALEAWKAKLYADSIKPQVANIPPVIAPTEEKEGVFSWLAGVLFGKKGNQQQQQGYQQR